MKLFSKIAFICNVSFVLFILLGYVEMQNKKNKIDDNIIPLPFVTGILVILGQFAVFLNLIFCLIAMILLLSKKMQQIPRWLVVSNYLFLLVQLYYFFIY